MRKFSTWFGDILLNIQINNKNDNTFRMHEYLHEMNNIYIYKRYNSK